MLEFEMVIHERAGGHLEALLLRSRTRQGCPLSPLVLSIQIEVLMTVFREIKERASKLDKKKSDYPYLLITRCCMWKNTNIKPKSC